MQLLFALSVLCFPLEGGSIFKNVTDAYVDSVLSLKVVPGCSDTSYYELVRFKATYNCHLGGRRDYVLPISNKTIRYIGSSNSITFRGVSLILNSKRNYVAFANSLSQNQLEHYRSQFKIGQVVQVDGVLIFSIDNKNSRYNNGQNFNSGLIITKMQ